MLTEKEQEWLEQLKIYAATAGLTLTHKKIDYHVFTLKSVEGLFSREIAGFDFTQEVYKVQAYADGYASGEYNAAVKYADDLSDMQELAADLREEIANLEKRLAIAEAAADGAAQQTKKRKI